MPGSKKPGRSILWPKVYEGLRKKGMSKTRAAKISNSMAGGHRHPSMRHTKKR
jgi:hypothetical protein